VIDYVLLYGHFDGAEVKFSLFNLLMLKYFHVFTKAITNLEFQVWLLFSKFAALFTQWGVQNQRTEIIPKEPDPVSTGVGRAKGIFVPTSLVIY